MRDYSAAFLALLTAYAKALFTPARGRHATAARRRRSTRVRRYAPSPAPVEASAPPIPKPAPRLVPPRESFPADEVALVRPYYPSHERDLDRVRAEATARLHAWVPRPGPSGDLLAAPVQPRPGEFDELAALVRTWNDQRTRRRGEVAV
ncbi:hypothetical protein BJF83_19240 [Nocardiopsis sp. CNR-923]|uniref:hypothetical protein n=1 Tax=Nocardiopsis sp. CNR-923 TaxID=1904965 RepID=UPI000969B25E|nr:hypothetical protein [Nocardiopsis sp. CNR-923]OLT27129.1 hypothetical protein BJF83_19240 [Nocardiopsis sp. CNR-923]